MIDRFAEALPFGAAISPEGQVSFRLWAPDQDAVAVAIESGPDLPMQRRPDGWFEAMRPGAVGLFYRFRLGEGTLVPDPASRGQADDVHGPSVVIDPRAYRWRNPAWRGRPWQETVIYELHAGVFGGFQGVRQQLPRLRELGVTAVELMPVSDFPGGRNWGYDGVLPFAPDAAYGTPDDLKALIDAAHGLGLMMFLDVVYNHFGPDGNYLGCYASPFFRQDAATPWGAAIDFRCPQVRAYFTANVLYWLNEYRFDGLRFDAVHAILEQDWVTEMAETVRKSVDPSRHVHLMMEHHNDPSHLRGNIDAQWNDDAHNALHVLLTGETGGYYADYAGWPAEALARCLAEGWAFQGQHCRYLGTKRGAPSADLPPTAHILFLQNHDQVGNRAFGERLTVLADPAALEAAIALQMLCPQIPLLFMGEETASRSPFLFFTDHNADLARIVCEGRRQEFVGFAAFADQAQREKIPDPNAKATFEASAPSPDPALAQERQALYRHLIALRQTEIVPRLAGAQSIGSAVIGPKAVRAAWTLGDGSVLTIACNLDRAAIPFPPPSGRQIFVSSTLRDELPGYCTAVFLGFEQ